MRTLFAILTLFTFLPGLGVSELSCALRDLDERRYDGLSVTTEGIVVDVLPDEVDVRYSILLLKDGAATLPVFCETALTQDILPDSHVRVTGTYQRLVDGFRRFSGPFINCTAAPTILAPPPTDRLDVPPIDPGNYVTPRDLSEMGRRSVCGRVLATWDGMRLMMRVGGFTINAKLATGQPLPPCGATVKLAGYPETNLYFLELTKALWRRIPDTPPPEENPVDMTVGGILASKRINPRIDSTCHGRLIRLRGIVRSLPGEGSSERRLYLDSGGYRLPVDFSVLPSIPADLSLGCEVEVTGRCLLECETWKAYDAFPQIRGIAIVLRTSDDVRVIGRPSWWTTGRLLIVIAALVLLLALHFIRNRIERAVARLKFSERTRLAVDIHDSLSQMLTGVACQVTASAEILAVDPGRAKERLGTAGRMLKSCREELTNCLYDLRNDILGEADLATAVRRILRPFAFETGIRLRIDVRRASLSDTSAQALLAILRELTANAIRHGTAATVRIAGCETSDDIRFSVRDDGSGFDTTRVPGPNEGHFGLCGIRDRLRRLSGTLEIRSMPGRGTRIRFSIPRKTKGSK